MIYLFSAKKASALGLPDKAAWIKIQTFASSLKVSDLREIQESDEVYIDISNLSAAQIKSAITLLAKNRAGIFVGIIDPKGAADDPAQFFFAGARDYIGSALVKKGLTQKRFADARKAQTRSSPAAALTVAVRSDTQTPTKRKSKKLPEGQFKGWKTMRAKTPVPFIFVFVSMTGKHNLRSKVGESIFAAAKTQLHGVLQRVFKEADALLWMEAEDHCLFLVPPCRHQAAAAVEACLKLISGIHLIGVEKLDFSFPIDFIIAMHYGETVFCAPGETGELISEAVNYIFHLGLKKAEAGRLIVSGDVPDDVIPQGLADIFVPAGVFKGIPIRQSRRFVFK